MGDLVTAADMLALFRATGGRCAACGEALSLHGGPRLVTLDRLDNRLGHVRGNCTLACLTCNRAHVEHA